MTDHTANGSDHGIDFPDEAEEPEVDPDIEIMEVRGEKEIGFMGMKHLEMPEGEKDKIHDVYADIIIELDDVKEQYHGPDRAWHVGRVLEEYNVAEHSEMTLTDLGAYNTIDDMYSRRLYMARHIHAFWPDQEYDPGHSITALGEFASRAISQDREEEARNGYDRLLRHGDSLSKTDVLVWGRLEEYTIEEMVELAAAECDTPAAVSETVKRVMLLSDQDPSSASKSTIEAQIKAEFGDGNQ